ncbi:MAG: hypothetical protein HWD59_10265 [Coxiellaceae bacterium]|nr:MAG: hypothetical protein HWD59_10265 [Coxiellaceae bacterium]
MLQNNFIIIEIDIAFNKIQDKEIITSIKNCLDRNRFTHNKSAKLTCHKEASNNNNQIPSTERKRENQ